jgi:CDP-paratose 2-epimerase
VLEDGQSVAGASSAGICEDFPLTGPRSLYGATKLSCELILQEYVEMYGVKAIVNRCGVLAGAWQMGKTDQGVITLWVARHLFRRGLAYIGYGGRGKQVRDVLHVDDLYRLLEIQLRCIERLSGRVFNVGGGLEGSVSLCELTDLCRQATGARIDIASEPANRPADVRLYVSDCRRIGAETQWKPTIAVPAIVEEIARWIRDNRGMLEPVLNG